MPSHFSRRTLIAGAIGLLPVGAARVSIAQQPNQAAIALSGQQVAWQAPWELLRHDQPSADIESFILAAGDATFALVTMETAGLDPAWDTPQEYRATLIDDLDASNRAILASFEDGNGAQVLLIDEDTDHIYYHCLSAPSSQLLVEMGFYAPLATFAATWEEAKRTITLDTTSLFTGFDESRIVEPVVALAAPEPVDPTPIANESERTFLMNAWAIHDDLDESTTAAHEAARGNDPFGDAILLALQPYVDFWSSSPDSVEALVPPSPAFESLHDSLASCAAMFAKAAELFGPLADYEDVARSAGWSEFTAAWDDADDELRILADQLATWERP